MSVERFRELADTWGAEAARWPQSERALFDLHAGTEQGRRVLAEAAHLDRFLDGFAPRAADPLRAARIVHAARGRSLQQRRGMAWASGAWAASAVLGFLLGYLDPGSAIEASDESYVQLLTGSPVLEDFL